MKHTFKCRVYYEDTDSGGVVYHSNYLKFAERARTEMLRSMGFSQEDLGKNRGIYIVVSNISVKFISPAKLDGEIEIETELQKINGASILLKQILKSAHGKQVNENIFVNLDATIVFTQKQDEKLNPIRIPDDIRNKFIL